MKKLALKYENLYYIGGVVRDELLGKKSLDIDITYQGNAIEFGKFLEGKRVGKLVQINEPFGTIRMEIKGQEVDIASTRDEIYDKKGHLPIVSNIGCPLKQDVLRRDFTINALAKSCKTGEIIDYVDGVKDIKSKTLRVLHDGSFIDDPTRIVRGLKFSVRFGFELDEHTKKLQEDYLENVNRDMSYKRLKKELMETFNLNSQKAFEEFFSQKIYKLLTEKNITPPKYNVEELVNKYPVEHTWLVYIGWMDIDRLPLTKDEQKIVDDFNWLKTANIKNDNYSLYKAFHNKSKEAILIYTYIMGSDLGLKFFELSDIKVSITGYDLKGLGIEPSKQYSECFEYVLEQKLNNPTMTKDEEIDLAKSFFR